MWRGEQVLGDECDWDVSQLPALVLVLASRSFVLAGRQTFHPACGVAATLLRNFAAYAAALAGYTAAIIASELGAARCSQPCSTAVRSGPFVRGSGTAPAGL